MNEPELNSRGFTLVELMVTLAIAAIIIGVVVPSLGTMFQNNKTTANINDFVLALNLARSEAVTRTTPVIACRSIRADHISTVGSEVKCSGGNNWEDGWIVFADTDGDGIMTLNADVNVCTSTDDCLLMVSDGVSGKYTLRSADASTRVTYNTRGSVFGGGPAGVTWQLCGPDQNSVKSHAVILSSSGRVRLTDGSKDASIASSACPTS